MDMEVICYGAGNMENPANTIKAIKHCSDISSEWIIQIDLQLTKDNEVILFKKNNTRSVTGEDILIEANTYSALKSLNVSYCFNKKNGTNYKLQIPKLEDVFKMFPNTKFLIDVHSSNKAIVSKSIALIEKYKMTKLVVISSKNEQIITFFKENKPKWDIAATTVGARKILYENMFYIDQIIPIDSNLVIIPKADKDSLFLRERIINYCNQKNKKTWTWVFENDKNSISNQILEFKKMGVNGIFTSKPSSFYFEMEMKNEFLQSIYQIV